MRVIISSGELLGGTALTKRADVQCYLGIPFAAPPIGPLRFRAPQPVAAWEGVLDAHRFRPAAPQNPDPFLAANDYFQPASSEADCLNLNIWTPRADGQSRPVMVWIHGGAYLSGSNSVGVNNGAELAATFDVVVVSINYRLGALGYLDLGHLLGESYQESGNVGILDQIAALQWVRDNILFFGGNPANVTIFGESAGGAAVGTLLGTPRAEGLFHRAIIQSGTAERARDQATSEEATSSFLDAAGLTTATASELLTMSVERILAAQEAFVIDYSRGVVGLPLPFQPTIDGVVLPVMPLEAIRLGTNSRVDLLAGTNLNEASLFTEPMAGDGDSPSIVRQKIERVIQQDHPSGDLTLLESYADAARDSLGKEVNDRQLLEALLTDRLYRQPTNRLLDARATSAGANYAYLFTWLSPLYGGRLGACHVLELPFIFRQLHRIEAVSLVGEHAPQILSDWMSAAWVRFADIGVPGSAALPKWQEYAEPNRLTMELNETPGLRSDPLGRLREFWHEASVGAD